jgi:hypothetical protein
VRVRIYKATDAGAATSPQIRSVPAAPGTGIVHRMRNYFAGAK